MKKIVYVLLFAFVLNPAFAQDAVGTIPEMDLKTIENASFNTKNIKNNGKPFIVLFWASSCKPCMRMLNEIHTNYAQWTSETGVKIFAISVDDSKTKHKVLMNVKGRGWKFPAYIDEKSELKKAMKVSNLPHYFIYDKTGKLIKQKSSYVDGDGKKMIELLQK